MKVTRARTRLPGEEEVRGRGTNPPVLFLEEDTAALMSGDRRFVDGCSQANVAGSSLVLSSAVM